ncbi:hypothetical protein C2845_PM05G26020 [Panicum miliaceum]|uniref:Uncharacterized protein n=1 Tax=Panicum miliaceum TaxID=4540 RepID=A0A3L6SYR0_PANMI|nr:hypothetical protein C2845_PM05G26020 [Panicum miliaceum]
MADPNPGIDLNLPACEIDPAEDAQVVWRPVVEVYMSNPIDWDEDGTDDIFIEFRANIGQGSSSGTNVIKRKQYSDDTKRAVYAICQQGCHCMCLWLWMFR